MSRFSTSHPGIQMAEQLFQRADFEDVKTHLSKLGANHQERINKDLNSAGGAKRLSQEDIDTMRNIEVATAYVAALGTSDENGRINDQAQRKVANAQKGLSASGSALMSTSWQNIRDQAQKPDQSGHDSRFRVEVQHGR